ncbi:MAG: hypothetical protein IJH53_06005 [Oscillospiraceae bacterium]|nr:hypothetical protein [Oscillospiraceae bacterium]
MATEKEKEELLEQAEEGPAGASGSGRTAEVSPGLSYEEWTDRIKGAMESDGGYQAAMAKLAEVEGSRPEYAGTYDDDILRAYDKILRREGFRYSLDDDALYQQYADRFMAAGKLAMRDTMGQASALTGGYGSSYGQAAGQQTYDAWLQGLGDVALEMYDRAYGRYRDEGKALTEAYERARDMGGEEYARYQDALGQWNKDRSYAADAAGEARDRAYRTDSEAWDRYRQERQFEYDKQTDYAATLAKYGDFSGYAELFGEDRAAQMRKVWIAGNFDLAYNSGMISADEYRAMTGKWPPGYSTGGGGGGGTRKKDSGNRYDAVLTEVRIMDASGSSTGTIQNKLDSAYGAGALTKPQYTWLTSNFGSGNTSGNTGSSGVKKPGQGMQLA